MERLFIFILSIRKKTMPKFLFVILCLLVCSLTACSLFMPRDAVKPKNTENVCAIFKEKTAWYQASLNSYKKWGVPVPVQMAIMHQESHFVSDAQPPSGTLLGFIPWFTASSAYGYPQSKDETWHDYQRKTGNTFAQRDNFSDACDFVGWYSHTSYKKLGISKTDAKNLYLAYHEGHSGFQNKSYLQKPWLVGVSGKVAQRAELFKQQLATCNLISAAQ